MPDRIARENDLRRDDLAALSPEAFGLYHRLKLAVDDFGRFPAHPDLVRAACYALVLERYPTKAVERFLRELVEGGVVRTYQIEGREYLLMAQWDRDQRRRAQHSKYPAPVTMSEPCRHADNMLPTDGQPPAVEISSPRDKYSSRSESREAARGAPPVANNTHTTVVFTTPEDWLEAIAKAPSFRAVRGFQNPAWWQAELRANHGVRFEDEIPKAQAYLLSHPERHYKDFVRFLHGWFGRADRVEAPR